MSWLEKLLPPKIQQTDPTERRTVPEGLWIKCPACDPAAQPRVPQIISKRAIRRWVRKFEVLMMQTSGQMPTTA